MSPSLPPSHDSPHPTLAPQPNLPPLTPSPPPPAQNHPLEAKKIVRPLSPPPPSLKQPQRENQANTNSSIHQAILEAKIAALEAQIQETDEKRREIDGQLR